MNGQRMMDDENHNAGGMNGPLPALHSLRHPTPHLLLGGIQRRRGQVDCSDDGLVRKRLGSTPKFTLFCGYGFVLLKGGGYMGQSTKKF
jgi:hypothetical protein